MSSRIKTRSAYTSGCALPHPHYFDGRAMTAAAFQMEHDYWDARSRMIAQTHGCGVAWGLGLEVIKPTPPPPAYALHNQVRLSPGVAFDGMGRAIEVTGQHVFTFEQLVAQFRKEPRAAVADNGTRFRPCLEDRLLADHGGPAEGAYVLALRREDRRSGAARVYGSGCEPTCDHDVVCEAFGLSLLHVPTPPDVAAIASFTPGSTPTTSLHLSLALTQGKGWALRGKMAAVWFDYYERKLHERWGQRDPSRAAGPFPREATRWSGPVAEPHPWVPLALLYYVPSASGGTVEFLDPHIPRRMIMATTAASWAATLTGASSPSTRWARLLQFQQQLAESLDADPDVDRLNLHARGFCHLPPCGFLPVGDLSGFVGRFTLPPPTSGGGGATGGGTGGAASPTAGPPGTEIPSGFDIVLEHRVSGRDMLFNTGWNLPPNVPGPTDVFGGNDPRPVLLGGEAFDFRNAGTEITFTAIGEIEYQPGARVDADGIGGFFHQAHGLKNLGLIGVWSTNDRTIVQAAPPFDIGKGPTRVPVPPSTSPLYLFLGFNDVDAANNKGTFDVRIALKTSHQPPTKLLWPSRRRFDVTVDVNATDNLFYGDPLTGRKWWPTPGGAWPHLGAWFVLDPLVRLSGSHPPRAVMNVQRAPHDFRDADGYIDVLTTGEVTFSSMNHKTGPDGGAQANFYGFPAVALIGIWSKSGTTIEPYGGRAGWPFTLGSSNVLRLPPGSDPAFLFLGVNDNYFIDNQGHYRTTFSYTPKTTAGAPAPSPTPSTGGSPTAPSGPQTFIGHAWIEAARDAAKKFFAGTNVVTIAGVALREDDLAEELEATLGKDPMVLTLPPGGAQLSADVLRALAGDTSAIATLSNVELDKLVNREIEVVRLSVVARGLLRDYPWVGPIHKLGNNPVGGEDYVMFARVRQVIPVV
jgi:hypothetical protein